jgi:peptide-methionine (R)-S-oxide reductase
MPLMTRLAFLRGIAFSAGTLAFARMAAAFEKLKKSDEEWRRILSPAAFAVLFEDDTERAFTSPLNEEKRKGQYLCAACFLPLFESSTKFESGTGWPSFFAPLKGRTETKRDLKFALLRTEYHCARCGGHQGHVFDDGPPPTGQRWCNNGVALRFVPSGEPLPALRS